NQKSSIGRLTGSGGIPKKRLPLTAPATPTGDTRATRTATPQPDLAPRSAAGFELDFGPADADSSGDFGSAPDSPRTRGCPHVRSPAPDAAGARRTVAVAGPPARPPDPRRRRG